MAQVVFAPKTEGFCNPAEGIVTSSCGERENPLLEKTEFHNGLDIAMAEGTEVAAVKSGVVTKYGGQIHMVWCWNMKPTTAFGCSMPICRKH